MKRNLLKGIILIGAVALSSCATLTDVSNPKPFGDDVYYTKAKAGVSDSYIPGYVVQQPQDVVRNDDYYYYGDYESRIRRFNYASPFDYGDDYYDNYVPYSLASNQQTASYTYDANDYTYDPYYNDLGVYSAYDFGYGDYWGYDNYGYGLAYSTFVYSGGTRATHKKDYSYTNNNDGPVFTKSSFAASRYRNALFGINAGKGQSATTQNSGGLVFTKGNVSSDRGNNMPVFTGMRPGGNNAVYPGRPGTNAGSAQTSAIVAGTNRPIRPTADMPRSQPQMQQPAFERNSSPPPSSSNNSGGGGTSSGGGGRPVRP